MKPDFTPKNTGIMFQADMIRAYLEGRKNQTRRVKGLQAINQEPDNWQLIFTPEHQGVRFVSFGHVKTYQVVHLNMPYGGKGDSLYFKETWKMFEREKDGRDFLHYRADDAKVDQTWWTENDWRRPDPVWHKEGVFENWQPSMFMPRICSRFREVPIVNVRIERLQDITQEDAWYEGIVRTPDLSESAHLFKDPTYEYFSLWDSINGKTLPASKNPWVWVYEFPLKKE